MRENGEAKGSQGQKQVTATMTKIEFGMQAVEAGWRWDQTDPDRFRRGHQQAVILDRGDFATEVTILERKTLRGQSGRMIPQLVETWTGTVEAFLEL